MLTDKRKEFLKSIFTYDSLFLLHNHIRYLIDKDINKDEVKFLVSLKKEIIKLSKTKEFKKKQLEKEKQQKIRDIELKISQHTKLIKLLQEMLEKINDPTIKSSHPA